MRARETTFRELYAGDVVYVTPAFQRSYGHTENAVKRMLTASLAAEAPPYFLGALVTRELGVHLGVRKALLIDGNQRLMTLLMLLLALRDTLARDAPEEAEYLNRLGFLRDGGPSGGLKNIVVARDRAAFDEAVAGGGFRDPCHPLAQAYAVGAEIFGKCTREGLSVAKERLLDKFTFVVLALAADDDPYPIFKLFNPGDDAFTRMGRDTYTQFAQDPELMDLIAGGESQEVEFKAHSTVTGRHAKEEGAQGVSTVIRAVAAMLNSYTGGTLLIGVEDNGAICGVEGEYATVDRSKRNWDGYELHLANTLRAKLTARNAFLHYRIERRSALGHDVCLVRITPADEPVYIDKRLYVRTFNQTVEMLGPDLVDYVARRFAKPSAPTKGA
jgi:hypothetical protein